MWMFRSLLSDTSFLRLVCVVLPLAQVSMTSSIYLTLSIAVERYTTVCHPWYKVSFNILFSVYNSTNDVCTYHYWLIEVYCLDEYTSASSPEQAQTESDQ